LANVDLDIQKIKTFTLKFLRCQRDFNVGGFSGFNLTPAYPGFFSDCKLNCFPRGWKKEEFQKTEKDDKNIGIYNTSLELLLL